MSFSLSVARAALYFQSGCLFQCLYNNIHGKAIADFYIGLYSQPGNLGQRSVTISTLFLFNSFHWLQALSVHACMHCDACMRYTSIPHVYRMHVSQCMHACMHG